MYIVRFSAEGKVKYGILDNNVIRGFKGRPFSNANGSFAVDGSTYKLKEVKLLAPCRPSKIIGVGRNYLAHVEEIDRDVPSVPMIFMKPTTAIVGPGGKIVLPGTPGKVDYEGELGVVIGKRAKNVSEDQATKYVLGYTCFNDVSERNAQKLDGQWTRAKGYDTFAPMGPCISTGISPDNLKIETYLNGEVRQSASTSSMIFGVAKLISFITGVMTLLPGDVIATGTPSGIGQIKPGDVVEVKIEKIGTLKNFVVA